MDTRSPGTYSTNLNGPVPIIALPELKSAVLALSALALTIRMLARSVGSRGAGVPVRMWMVYGSMTLVSLTEVSEIANDDGLLGTVGARLKVAITSLASKSEPSENLTPLRSLNSHVVSSSGFHDSASPGFRRSWRSWSTSVSKKWRATIVLGVRL